VDLDPEKVGRPFERATAESWVSYLPQELARDSLCVLAELVFSKLKELFCLVEGTYDPRQ
jgi:hypothetical protein